jgi:hypothetical protein
MVAHACHSSFAGSINRSIVVEVSLGIMQDPISKNPTQKGLVEWLN